MFVKKCKRGSRGRKGRQFGPWPLLAFLLIVAAAFTECQPDFQREIMEGQDTAGNEFCYANPAIAKKVNWKTVDVKCSQLGVPPDFRQKTENFGQDKPQDARENMTSVVVGRRKDAIIVIGTLVLVPIMIYLAYLFKKNEEMQWKILKLNGQVWEISMAYDNLKDELEDSKRGYVQDERDDILTETKQLDLMSKANLNRVKRRKQKSIKAKNEKILTKYKEVKRLYRKLIEKYEMAKLEEVSVKSKLVKAAAELRKQKSIKEKNKKVLTKYKAVKRSYRELIEKYEITKLEEESAKSKLVTASKQIEAQTRANKLLLAHVHALEIDIKDCRASLQQQEIKRSSSINELPFVKEENKSPIVTSEVQTIALDENGRQEKESRTRGLRVRKRIASLYRSIGKRLGRKKSADISSKSEEEPMLLVGPGGDFLQEDPGPKSGKRFKNWFSKKEKDEFQEQVRKGVIVAWPD